MNFAYASRAAFAAAIASLSLAAACRPAGGEPPRTAPSALFVLGDSLSDVGNAAASIDVLLGQPYFPMHTVGLCNPIDVFVLGHGCDDLIYERSRATNGPVAAEVLAAGLGLAPLEPSFHTVPQRPTVGSDYAVAGATAAGTGIDDLRSQVDRLRLDHRAGLPADALYVVMIGGNDALAALHDAAEARAGLQPGEDARAVVAAAVSAIGDAVETLAASGARLIVVTNLPNLAVLPVVKQRAADLGLTLGEAEAAATDVTAAFNDELAARLAVVVAAHPEATIAPFDLFSALQALRAADAAAGVDVTEACFDSDAYRSSPTAERRFSPGCMPLPSGGPRFDAYFFWDAIHPTARVHAALGQALLDAYETMAPR